MGQDAASIRHHCRNTHVVANASKQSGQPNENIMFDNSLKILLRTALKRFLVFGLNVLGLSIGISCVIFITIYSIDELSFDKHFQNHDRIYSLLERQPAPYDKSGKERLRGVTHPRF